MIYAGTTRTSSPPARSAWRGGEKIFRLAPPQNSRVATRPTRRANHRYPCQALSIKIFWFSEVQITSIFPPSRPTEGGGSRSSRTRGGMRWTLRGPVTYGTGSGRRRRVVLAPQRLASSWRSNPPATVSNKPDHRGEHDISRKPLRGECRVDSWCDRGDYPGAAFFSARQLRAHWAPGIPCALSSRAGPKRTPRAKKSRGEIADSYPAVIARSESDEAIHFFLAARDGLLRSRSQGRALDV